MMRHVALGLAALALLSAPALAAPLLSPPILAKGPLASSLSVTGGPRLLDDDSNHWPYWLQYDCPDRDPVTPQVQPCPARLSARDDLLGAPVAAVDPTDPARWAVASLGGVPATGASPHSRGGIPHVLFTSQDRGLTFTRTPIPPPQEGLLGESVSMVADAQGRLVIAAVYSKPRGSDGFEFLLAAWKLSSFTDVAGLVSPKVFVPLTGEGDYRSAHLVHVPDIDAIALLWEEWGTSADNRSEGPTYRVRAATTKGDPAAPWKETAVPLAHCSTLVPAVAFGGSVWLACIAEGGFAYNQTVELKPGRFYNQTVDPGNIVLHGFDPRTGNFSYGGKAPFSGAPLISVAPDGRLGVLSYSYLNAKRVSVRFTSFQLPHNWTWSRPQEIGKELHNQSVDPDMRDARVSALAHQPAFDAFHFVYEERLTPAADSPTNDLQPRVRKMVGALDARGHLIYLGDLQADQPLTRLARDPTRPNLQGPLPDDPLDGLTTFGTRQVMAYGDSGTLVVGELVGPASTRAQPMKVKPSNQTTPLWTPPPREFTPVFLTFGAILGGLAVARVIVGRVVLKSKIEEPGDP